MKLVEFPVGATPQAYPSIPELPSFDAAALHAHRVDAHYLVTDADQVVARASLWWRDVPQLPGECLGVVGHFAARDAAAAVHLLQGAEERLVRMGCSRAVGPMDGTTWRRYRFVTDPGEEPPFFLEPENPPAYPGYFVAAGFSPIAGYSSALVTDLGICDPRVSKASKRLQAEGVRWRPLDSGRFEAELKTIYHLSLQSFTQNFLYTPIGEAEFLDQYRLIAPYVKPELTLLAEQEGELIGYLFALPDVNQARRGEAVNTVILKTVAVLPGRRSAGLGSVLVAEVQVIARQLGYRRAIHALMHERNVSRNISARYGHTMRRYTLYHKALTSAR